MNKFNTILLLNGGDSTRFWPLREKHLTKFLGKSFLAHQLERLNNLANNIIIVASSRNQGRVKEIINEKSGYFDAKVEVLVQDEKLDGIAGAILSAKNKISGDTLILNPNDYFDLAALHDLNNLRLQEKKDFIFLAKKVSRYFPGGYIKFDKGNVAGIIEKPLPESVPSDMVKLIADYFSDVSLLIHTLEAVQTQRDDHYEKALDEMISKKYKIGLVVYEGFWYTIKYPWHVLEMNDYFLSQIKDKKIGDKVQISENAKIEGAVHIGNNVKIGDFTKIVGPCFIDDEAIIGDFAMVRSSHIGKRTLVGGYSEVTRSYLGDDVMLHRNYVGDSVLADYVMMGAEAVTANFRFDQKTIKSVISNVSVDTHRRKFGAVIGEGSKIGVNSTINPGVKIGAGSYICPQSLVTDDVKDGVFFFKGERRENANRAT